MTALKLGRLERVELRAGWTHEAVSFTPWLAQAENLRLLGDTLGLNLELEGTEANVGPFRADILCRDVEADRLVLIENQLERTDHGHLGQILTYAAGLRASIVIWIAASFTEEHRGALDWLNEATDERFHFFGVEVELWRISGSPPAPRFNVVVKPNDWSRAASRAARSAQSGEMSELGQQRLAYWTAFKHALDDHPFPHKLNSGAGSPSISFPTSRPDVRLVAFRGKDGPGVFVRITGSDAASLYAFLEARGSDIEQGMGGPLSWREREPGAVYWITRRLDADPTEQADWPRQHGFLCETFQRFSEVLEPHLASYGASGNGPEPDF